METLDKPDVTPAEQDTSVAPRQTTDYYTSEQLLLAIRILRGFAPQVSCPNNLEVVLCKIELRREALDQAAYERFQQTVTDQQNIHLALWRGQPVKRKVKAVRTTTPPVTLTDEQLQMLEDL